MMIAHFRQYLFIAILTVAPGGIAQAAGEGGGASNGGGGGSGLVCFSTFNEAMQVRDQDGALAETARGHIAECITGDLMVTAVNSTPLGTHNQVLGSRSGDTPESYLNWVLETYWRQVDSQFVDQIESALSRVAEKNWQDRRSMPILFDQADSAAEPGAVQIADGNWCVAVQFIIRYQTVSPETERSVEIQADKDLINRLGKPGDEKSHIENVAALLLHEAIYVLERDLGQFNSSKVGPFVYLILAQATQTEFAPYTNQQRNTCLIGALKNYGLENLLSLYSVKPKRQ